MKVSLDWLNALLDRPISADEAVGVLTNQGFPVERREEVATTEGSDTVLDVEVTSNRGDCLSHAGVARELAAGTGRRVTPADPWEEREPAMPGSDPPAEALTSVAIEDEAGCPAYTARVIRGVRVGPSPSWLTSRLEALGLRPVNNVVDVTNYVLLETGQPLHAFDMGRLAGGRIVVRPARAGEAFAAIDGTRHTLPAGVMVIADAERPQAVAGVMGGRDSEVTGATTDVLLESARFDPVAVRRASRRLKLASDSSYRFERGVDPRGVERASRRAARLLLELAGGESARGVVRVGEPHESLEPIEVTMRTARCNALLGLDLTPADQVDRLDRLGLDPRLEGGSIACRVPTFRLDLRREVDLIEEVARMTGLDATPMRPKMAIVARPPQPAVRARQSLSDALVAHGYHETITPSFLPPPHAEAFAATHAVEVDPAGSATPAARRPMTLADERRKAEPALRTAVLPSLLRCRKANQDVGNRGVKLFELAHAWAEKGAGGGGGGDHLETLRLSMLADVGPGDEGGLALRGLKAALREAVEALGGSGAVDTLSIDPAASEHFDPAARVSLGDRALGTLGLASGALLDRFDLQSPVVAAELDAQPLLSLYPPTHLAGALPRFPGVERDLAVVVTEAVAWRDLERAIRGAGLRHVESIEFLSAYRGKPIARGRKSVALRLSFRRPDATLTGESVDAEVAKAVAALRGLGAELRG